jgi:opacity protein-like surface antigen
MKKLLIASAALIALSASAAMAASTKGEANRSCSAEANQDNKALFGPPGQAAGPFDVAQGNPPGTTSTSEYNQIKNDFRKSTCGTGSPS